MSATDWTAWLGPAADDLTDEQRERFEDEAERVLALYPDPDLSEDRETALSAVVQYLLGDETLDGVGARRSQAREAARQASIAARAMVALAVGDGMAEAEVARRVQVDRMQVRKWLGK